MIGMVHDTEPLRVADRCDRCLAQAYVRVTLATGELLFCSHHFTENREALERVALSIRNETEKLTAPAMA